jgi:ABC-type sugar transport system ATPase subunit
MLELKQLSKRMNGRPVLAEIDLEIAAGRPTAIAGLGATERETFARLLMGADKPDTGTITLSGADIARARREKGRIARVGPSAPAPSGQRVGKLVGVEMAARAGLSGALNARVSELKADLRMRLAVAQALAVRPALLVLDAPASQLTGDVRDTFAAGLKDMLSGFAGVVIVLASAAEEALGPDGDVVVIDAGAVVQRGTAQEVSGHPANLAAALATSWPVLNTLRMTARDGGGMLGDGSRLQLPQRFALPHAGNCTLAFHPEDVTLERASPGCVRFVVRAGVVDARGEHRFLHVNFAGAHWLCPLTTEAPVAGARLNAFIDASRLMMFDADGRALD